MSLSWQHCTHFYYSPLSLCLTAAAHVTHFSTRTHTYRNIWTTANQRGGPPFTISDWFRPRYKPNGGVFCWTRVSESRILFFSFLEWLDAPVRSVSRTREKLGCTCDQIGRTLEPCSHNGEISVMSRDSSKGNAPVTMVTSVPWEWERDITVVAVLAAPQPTVFSIRFWYNCYGHRIYTVWARHICMLCDNWPVIWLAWANRTSGKVEGKEFP